MTAGRRLIVCAIIAGAGTAAGIVGVRAQQTVFKSGVESVRIDALVTDGRKVLTGLAARDFQVTDNGVAQDVQLVSFDEVPLNVVIALDESSSLTGERLGQLRDASGKLAAILKQDDRASLLTFAETITLQTAPTTALNEVRRAITAARVADGTRPTALVDAVFSALLTAESDTGRALIVVFSDGVDTGSWLRGDAVLEIARRSDAVVYAVATFHGGRGDFLGNLVQATGGTMTEVEEGGDIGAAFLAVLNEFRQRYLISYSPKGVARDGWHTVNVRVKGRDANVTARPGYWGGR
jgi:VWFA-related protein